MFNVLYSSVDGDIYGVIMSILIAVITLGSYFIFKIYPSKSGYSLETAYLIKNAKPIKVKVSKNKLRYHK